MTDVFEYDHATGESKERDFTADELAQIELDKVKRAEEELVAAQRAVDKQELLERLGITADEAALLLS